ncbi:EamA family transporter [Pseudoroseomonas rhizosphaerae]|uniref:EamA family transporter n=1 Tax=Teichococcus rhizosphaerae TaxID=1335062 RepID=A0A2C7AHP1_9PROT|nr:DMT family transporter [Pseudoroseomonas rhizosphaerae]PHK96257.1 EamA family transporter [Pseudoroseomonas rhizosphaerae]
MSRPIPLVHAPPALPDDRAAQLAARRRAILCVMGAALTFALAAVAVKLLGGAIPVMQVILFRNLFAIPPLVLLALATVPPAERRGLLATRSPGWTLLRILFGLGGMFGSFYGYVHLPLATVTALGFTMPLFLTALSVPLLGEKVGWRRCSAVLVGFGGVLLMLRPGFSGEALPALPAAAVLGGAVAWALAMISIRRMGELGESGTTIVLWFAIGGTLVGAVAALPGWVWPTPEQWALLAAVGLISAVAQLLMTAAYRSGETTLIAPFEYSGLLWTMSLGVLIWGELPRAWDFVGIAVLVASGLYIWHREVRLGLKR